MIGGRSVVGSAGVCVCVAFSIGMSEMTGCVGCSTGFTGVSRWHCVPCELRLGVSSVFLRSFSTGGTPSLNDFTSSGTVDFFE